MTAQIPENIVYEGRPLALLCEPKIPADHPRISKISLEEARKDCEDVLSTALWRNYVGEWAVRDGVLYLTGVKGVFRLAPGPDLPATWYSGTLRMPTGPLVHYRHAGWFSSYGSELMVEVKDGRVVGVRTENYPE